MMQWFFGDWGIAALGRWGVAALRRYGVGALRRCGVTALGIAVKVQSGHSNSAKPVQSILSWRGRDYSAAGSAGHAVDCAEVGRIGSGEVKGVALLFERHYSMSPADLRADGGDCFDRDPDSTKIGKDIAL